MLARRTLVRYEGGSHDGEVRSLSPWAMAGEQEQILPSLAFVQAVKRRRLLACAPDVPEPHWERYVLHRRPSGWVYVYTSGRHTQSR